MLAVNIVYSNDTTNVEAEYIKTTFSFLIGFPFPTQSKGFKEVYRTKIGGRNTYYAPSALLTAKFQIAYNSKLSFGLLWEYFLAEFRDYFTLNYEIVGENIHRNFSEQLDIKTMPLLLILEYSPVTTPYKTYLGMGGGISFNDIYWDEEVNSNLSNDIRKTSVVYDNNPISAAIKLYTGLLLNFDKKSKRDFLGAIHFEFSINYIFRSLNIYESLNKQYVKPPEEFSENYLILPFYMNLSAGISFNLFHELKNMKK